MELSDRIAKTLTPLQRELLTQEQGPPDFFGSLRLIFERGKLVRLEDTSTRLADTILRKG